MAESENPSSLPSVEEAAEQAVLFSRVLCPLYDSEPEPDSDSEADSDSDSESNLSTISDDDDNYHSLPSSPMSCVPPESDLLLLDSSQDFFDSCPMDTDVSIYDEVESDYNPDLVDWVSTGRTSRYSVEVVSEQEADMDFGLSDPESEIPDPAVLDSDDLPNSSFVSGPGLEEPFPSDEVFSTEVQLLAQPDWAESLERAFREHPLNLDLNNMPNDLFDCLPEQDPNPNPNPNPNPELEPDWEAISTDNSSVPDLEDMVRNLEWEVLLAVNNIYESDAEVTFFRQFLEQDSTVKGGPPASKSAVDNLPTVTVDEGKGDLHCAVCKEPVLVGESVKRLPCSHDYHASCILPWLGIRNTCPLCRFELPTDDPSYESWRARQENQV